MPEQYYKEALKAGQKEKRNRISKGESPYLLVLDQILEKEGAISEKRIGLMQVPAELIVGTKTEGRTNAFASNFMPLLSDGTEFAFKWKVLCDAHLEEGIRDPIKVYEYKNRYYVEEGNKRVSVLKYFGAVSIPGQVIRILPPKDETTKLYYEFLDFFNSTKINYIELTKEGSYLKLQKYLGKEPEEKWTEEECSAFRANYYYFRHVYEELGGNELQCTVGDAFLTYVSIYGYASLKEKTGKQIRQEIESIWDELKLLQEEKAIEIRQEPEVEAPKSFLGRLFSEEKSTATAAFIYDKEPEKSGWTYGHELGRQHVERVFGKKIRTSAYTITRDKTAESVLKQAVDDGNEILFTVSPKLLNASLTTAVENPDRVFLNCSLHKSHRYVRSYYARMYEAKFIIGAIAGILTENDRIGYVCDYPIVGQIAGINAFALGVQMVNPKAKVYLEWSSVQGTYIALARLRKKQINIISSMDFIRPGSDVQHSFGLYSLNEKGKVNLAMPIWHWGIYYEKLIKNILNKTVQREYENSKKAVNYYWGMSADVVDVIYSKNLPESVKKLADLLKKSVKDGLFNPFCGVIRTQDGRMIDKGDQGLSLEEIIKMDWLADNVEGVIPVYEQLSDEGKETVDSAGIFR